VVKIHCLGACREVGRSGFLIDSSKNILTDYGLMVESNAAPLPPKPKPHALFLTHGHLDHVGMAAAAHRDYNCSIYATKPTISQTELLLRDNLKIARIEKKPKLYSQEDTLAMMRTWKNIKYKSNVKIGKTTVEIRDAGHLPGSCCLVVNTNKKRIFYSGDFKLEPTRLVNGADILDLEDIDVAIMETTYSFTDHPKRQPTEKKLHQVIKETIENNGIAVLPSFAMRAPEILMILDAMKLDFPIYLDGMGKAATEISLDNPSFLRDPEALNRASNNTIKIYGDRDRKEALKKPCVIVTTSGCLEGGPVGTYIKHLYTKENCSLVLTGYQIPRTTGRYLIETGRYIHGNMDLKLKMRLEHLDFSGHAGRTDLLKFIKKVRPEKVVCVHGEYCQKFATELKSRYAIDAVAPYQGDIIKV
jgi:putative mRNA 3-end processing factor